MSRYAPILVIGLTAFALAEEPDRTGPARPEIDADIPVTDKPFRNDPRDFQFVVVSDRTGGHRPGVFGDATEKTNLLQPEFVITVGDMIEGYSHDRALIERQWDEFDALADRFEAPFFYVPGNHDYTNELMAEVWKQRYGRSYYHFLYHDVLFLCLNTEDGGLGKLADEQTAYAKDVLSRHADARWTFVFMHEPIWHEGYGQPHPDWAEIEAALGNRPFTVFAGHWHGYRRAVRNDRRYYILSVTGGGSRMRGEAFGEFDHVVWVTMKDQGPVIANLTLDGILPEDVLTSEQYNLAYGLSRAYSIACEPLRIDGPIPDAATLTMSVTNRSDLPLRVTGAFGPTNGVHVHPHAVDTTVSAGRSLTQPIELSHLQDHGIATIPTLTFRGFVEWRPDGSDAPLRLPVAVSTAVYRPATLEKLADDAPGIGGKLSESFSRLHTVDAATMHLVDPLGTWTGDGDCSYRFGVAYTDETLEIAIRVRDESLVLSPDRPPWEQDGIELRIDPRDDPDRSLNTSPHEQRGESFLFLAFSPAPDGGVTFFEPERVPSGVEVVWQPDAEGYAAHVRIPNRVLDAMRNGAGPWSAIRLNLAVDDVDDASDARSQLWWQPDWRTELHRPGSGTLIKP